VKTPYSFYLAVPTKFILETSRWQGTNHVDGIRGSRHWAGVTHWTFGKNVLFPGFSDRSDDIADHAYDKRTSNHGYQGVNKKH